MCKNLYFKKLHIKSLSYRALSMQKVSHLIFGKLTHCSILLSTSLQYFEDVQRFLKYLKADQIKLFHCAANQNFVLKQIASNKH